MVSYIFLNYKSMTTHLQEIQKIQNRSNSVVQLLSHVGLFVTSQTAARQASLSFTASWSLLKLMSIESAMLQPASPSLNLSQHQGLFQWVSSPHQMAKVLGLQLHHQSFQWIFWVDFLNDWLVWSPCSPRDSQESSSTSQFKSINSSALSFLCGPTLTSIQDYWKNLSFD